MKFLLSNNPQNLAAERPDVTVEAEYGAVTVEGAVLTMAHHGANAGNPAPCAYPNGCAGENVEVVGLSHLDLDSIGGCMAVLGCKPPAPGFWRIAEFVDLSGPHRLGEANAAPEDVERLRAVWAWSESHRTFPPRDGSVADVTEAVLAFASAVAKVLEGDPEMLRAGREFAERGKALNSATFREVRGSVCLRRTPGGFVNHLYDTPKGDVCKAVVSYNDQTGAVTVSFADTPSGEGARGIVQGLWGPLAGGHAGIAGSPRDQRMSWEDALAAAEAVIAYLA